ncbi:MAG: hypothetical protein Kow00124_18880 [Anaerolineae bacterium]
MRPRARLSEERDPINHKARIRWEPAALLLILILLAACGGGRTSIARPTAIVSTPVPTRTPLPPPPTVPPPGSVERPLVLLFGMAQPAAEDDAAALSAALSEAFDLTFEVRVTDSYREVRDALCRKQVVLASLDAFSYLVASADGCADLRYVLEINGATSTQGQLVARDEFDPRFFRGDFCRTGAYDLTTWVMPRLYLLSGGVDPVTSFNGIIDVADDEAVIQAVLDLECGLGATTLGAEADLSDLPNIDRLQVLHILPPVPNDVVVVPGGLDDSTQALLGDLLREHRDDLADLLGADDLVTVDEGAFEELRTLLDQAGVDIASLAQ